MKKKIIIGLIIGIVAAVGAGVFLYQQPSETVVNGRAAFVVDASQIFNEYNDDESVANQKYLNQVISVRGRVSDVSAMDSLGVNVVLATSNPLFGVSCQIPQPDETSSVKVGDQVTIKGLCTGKLMDVVLTRCLIESKIN